MAGNSSGQRSGRVVLQDAEKGELVKERSYRTRDEATQDIFKYIELYYNRVRMHSTPGYMSPMEYERKSA